MSRTTLSRSRRRRFCTAGHIVHVVDPDVFLATQGARVYRPDAAPAVAVGVEDLGENEADAQHQLACADCGALASVDDRRRCAECTRARRTARYRHE